MPTANKDTKTIATTAAELQDPQKLVQNLVDKKIRNLEKRKSRLQELRDLSAKGQELEPEQQKAIKKLEQVVEMIDNLKDLNKSISEVLVENAKQQKKISKKELLDKQIERQQQELSRLKTIIQFQDILAKFEITVRQDFSKGLNGAIVLTEEELTNLDKLYAITSDVADSNIETTAEKLIALADGKPREAWPGVTFQQLKELMTRVVESKYFSHETTPSTTITPTKQQTVVSTKADDSSKKFTKDTETTNTTKAPTTPLASIPNSEFNPSLTQLQSQFVSSGISFMNNPLEKDPAVVAVASVPNSYSYQAYGLTNDSLISNSIPDSNNSSINAQKSSNYDNTSSLSTIPTQTYTNQQFAGIPLIPNTGASAVFTVPVTLATVPMTGLVAQDLTGQHVSDLMVSQTYANQQNFINSSAPDKHQNPSHDQRGPNFNSEDNYRNNRMRGNRPDVKKNINGSGNRSRNANKGPGFQNQNQNQMFGNYPKQTYDNNHLNGSSFGANTFGEKTSNYSANRGQRSQANRPNRTDARNQRTNPNANYNPNTFGTTAAK